jgi:cubilin
VPGADYINLEFTEFSTERGYDIVRVYDGSSTGDILLGEFSGTSLPDLITSSGGTMLVHFTSDHGAVSSGWRAEYTSGVNHPCLDEVLTEETGTLDDNSANQDYMSNANCQKLIIPENVLNITLTFTDFVLEDGNDFVRVYDGSTTSDELLGVFTGTTRPPSITSSGGSMLIRFTSNESVNAAGWAASYTSTPSPCGSCVDETFTSTSGTLTDNSCDGNYANNADCRKLIQVPDADYINLIFTEFSMDQGNDYVRIYDGPSTGDLLLGEFTGTSLPDVVTSSGGSMLVHFTTDNSITGPGWNADYTSGKFTASCVDETFTTKSGIFNDNSGDLNYPSNADCQKLIAPGDAYNITLTFTEFDLENGNDFVRIYDGSTTGDALLGEFSGTSLPDPVTSSGSTMLIHFTSNSNVQASGWEASYTTNPFPKVSCLDETFTAPSGAFSDNSYDEEYANMADCRKLIQVPGADYIYLVFTEFNIEWFDHVRVYDGTTTEDVLLGEFTGTTLPSMVISTGGSMLVHFTSDNSGTGPGWKAEYSSGTIEASCNDEILKTDNGIVSDMSGDLDYSSNADCQKLIAPEDVLNITLAFAEFDLEEGNDYVRVYDGATTGDPLLGEFTGTMLPKPITSTGGAMLIHFTSNGSVNGSGWVASYTSQPPPCDPCMDERLSALAGIVSDNSRDARYENFADCRKLIQVYEADFINLVFTEFSLEMGNDYVRVYDGQTTEDKLLGEFTGTSLPDPISSSGSAMLIQFTSNATVNASGWSASYQGMKETGNSTVTAIPDISKQPDKKGILVYPNPAEDIVTIETANKHEISKIEFFDLYGRLIRIEDNVNSSTVTLQIGDLQTGIYLLRIRATDMYTKNISIW